MSGSAFPGRDRPRRLDAFETIYQTAALALRRSFRGGRIIVALVLVLLPLTASLPVAHYSALRQQEEFFYSMLSFYHFGIAVPAVALVFATAFPWPEAEEGTLTYWFTAPVNRWCVHLGRFLAGWVVGAIVLPLSVVAIAVPLDSAPASELGSVAVTSVSATLLAYPAYLAFFWLVATISRRGLAVGVFFILIENFMSIVPSNIVRGTLIHYVRSMIHPAVPATSRMRAEKLLHVIEPTATSTAVLTFVLVWFVALVLSLLLVEWIEYRGKTSQAT